MTQAFKLPPASKLTHRLTYWLPVLPGWAALRLLQGRGYV